MQDNNETEEIKQLKREIAKLRLEGNLRKSLSNQLTIQKKIADDAKAEALTKSEELAKISNQLAKYLSPQIHEQIFSGKQSAEVKSNRKKLTVFFSDIVNFTDKSEVFITRALSPAKPVDLYIDDDRKYCVAIFDEGGLENAVGRSGVNINLASKLTGYTIDAYTKSEYDEVLINQKTNLESLDGITKTLSNKLSKADIVSVADYLNIKKYVLTEELELNDKEISSISEAVNSFIEITHNKEKEVEETIENIEENIELDSIVEEQNIEEVDPIDEEPAEEVELPEEVDDSEQDSLKNIEEKE